MNSATNKNNGGIGLLGWIVILSAFLLYFKTADVLMLFAPPSLNMMLGMNVDWLYGYFNAALVEGLALVLHFHPRAKLSPSAQIVKWITLGISGLCQIYDGQVVTNTIATMSDPLKLGFSYGVPLIPLFIVIMIFAIGRLPDDEEPAKPFVGVKNMFKPAFKRFWEGDKVVVQQNRVPVSLHSPEPNPEPQIHPELIRQLEEVVRQYSGNGHNGSGGSQGSNFP